MLPHLHQNTDERHVSVDPDQSSMLGVICNQRDRFRTRLQETEEVCLMLILTAFYSVRHDCSQILDHGCNTDTDLSEFYSFIGSKAVEGED